MRSELETTKAALAKRKTIHRAKGIGEHEAYSLLRRTAMDQGRRIRDVGSALVTAADLLK